MKNIYYIFLLLFLFSCTENKLQNYINYYSKNIESCDYNVKNLNTGEIFNELVYSKSLTMENIAPVMFNYVVMSDNGELLAARSGMEECSVLNNFYNATLVQALYTLEHIIRFNSDYDYNISITKNDTIVILYRYNNEDHIYKAKFNDKKLLSYFYGPLTMYPKNDPVYELEINYNYVNTMDGNIFKDYEKFISECKHKKLEEEQKIPEKVFDLFFYKKLNGEFYPCLSEQHPVNKDWVLFDFSNNTYKVSYTQPGEFNEKLKPAMLLGDAPENKTTTIAVEGNHSIQFVEYETEFPESFDLIDYIDRNDFVDEFEMFSYNGISYLIIRFSLNLDLDTKLSVVSVNKEGEIVHSEFLTQCCDAVYYTPFIIDNELYLYFTNKKDNSTDHFVYKLTPENFSEVFHQQR